MKKRKDGRYQKAIMIGYTSDGKPKRKFVYGKTQKEVSDKANELRLLLNMGLELDNDITVAEWAETWLRTYKSGVEYKTYEMYEFIVRKYINKPLGHMKLKNIKTAHLQKIINDNKDKSWIIRKFKLTSRQMLEQAAINDLIIKNPAYGIIMPVIQIKNNKKTLSCDEVKRIIDLNLQSKDKCYIMLLLYTGMRKSEALAISKSDVDKSSMMINVNKTLIFKSNQSEIKYNPKTKSGVRSIPILEPLKDTLFSYMDSISTDLLFASSDGGTMSGMGYRRMWERFSKAMGSKDITAHMFRHNFATILYNAGVDVKAAQSILGHSSITVTMDIYTHLSDKNKDEATDKLNIYLTTK